MQDNMEQVQMAPSYDSQGQGQEVMMMQNPLQTLQLPIQGGQLQSQPQSLAQVMGNPLGGQTMLVQVAGYPGQSPQFIQIQPQALQTAFMAAGQQDQTNGGQNFMPQFFLQPQVQGPMVVQLPNGQLILQQPQFFHQPQQLQQQQQQQLQQQQQQQQQQQLQQQQQQQQQQQSLSQSSMGQVTFPQTSLGQMTFSQNGLGQMVIPQTMNAPQCSLPQTVVLPPGSMGQQVTLPQNSMVQQMSVPQSSLAQAMAALPQTSMASQLGFSQQGLVAQGLSHQALLQQQGLLSQQQQQQQQPQQQQQQLMQQQGMLTQPTSMDQQFICVDSSGQPQYSNGVQLQYIGGGNLIIGQDGTLQGIQPQGYNNVVLPTSTSASTSSVSENGGQVTPTSTAAPAAEDTNDRLPIATSEEPQEPQLLYVNAKQYNRILKRREQRARLESLGKISRKRQKYLHESRHKHAIHRPRGEGGRFFSVKKENDDSNSKESSSNGAQDDM